MEAAANSASINAGPANTNGFDAIPSRSAWHGDVQQIQKEVQDTAGWVLRCKQRWRGSSSGNDTWSTV